MDGCSIKFERRYSDSGGKITINGVVYGLPTSEIVRVKCDAKSVVMGWGNPGHLNVIGTYIAIEK